MNRRHFIKAAALAPFAGSVLLSRGMHLLNPKYKFAIATYSYWHFREPKVTVQEVIDHAANLGAQGVDVLHVQMDNESPEYLKFLRKHANDKGVELICLSIHQDFVDPDPAERDRNIEHTIPKIRGFFISLYIFSSSVGGTSFIKLLAQYLSLFPGSA